MDTPPPSEGPPSIVMVRYIDYTNYYSGYGLGTLLILVLIFYYYVRREVAKSPVRAPDPRPARSEGFTASRNFSDTDYKHGPLLKGDYGDTTVYLYDKRDILHVKDWYKIYGGSYIPNSKTHYQDTNRPAESVSWALEDHAINGSGHHQVLDRV